MGKTLIMIFEKPSTRTRISFELAMKRLGGNSIILNPEQIHYGRGNENIRKENENSAEMFEQEKLRKPGEMLRYQKRLLQNIRRLETVNQKLSTARVELAGCEICH